MDKFTNITITSEIFENEWAESFLKAILDNISLGDEKLIGFNSCWKGEPFVIEYELFMDGTRLGLSSIEEITFNIDESFKVDWKPLIGFDFRICYDVDGGKMGYHVSEFNYCKNIGFDLDWLSQQKGIELT